MTDDHMSPTEQARAARWADDLLDTGDYKPEDLSGVIEAQYRLRRLAESLDPKETMASLRADREAANSEIERLRSLLRKAQQNEWRSRHPIVWYSRDPEPMSCTRVKDRQGKIWVWHNQFVWMTEDGSMQGDWAWVSKTRAPLTEVIR